MKKNTIKLNESSLRKIIKESVNNVLSEMGYDREQAEIMRWNQTFDKCSDELMRLKQEVWKENGNENTPLLDLAFDLYKLCSFAKPIINR